MIAAPDEYAMRIAQTESALIYKEYSSPFIVPIPVFPAPQRTPSPWAGVKGTPYRASCKQTTTVQSSGHGKTRYRSSSPLCLAISPLSAACFFWLVRQCTGHLRV
ncbi:hypothetical protein TNCV_2574331 [Trichonephila clavipes]|nr:hypothetical protein TNCV_2574331 [Trichonephila clavipes]